jgi:acetyl esterase/lipase
MYKTITFCVCLALLLSACAHDRVARYAAVKSEVSYASVVDLDFAEATARLVYADNNPELQYGLLWLPEDLPASKKAPLVILIHGGCWLNQFDIQHSFPLATALAEAGYGVWSLEYRRSGDEGGGWPGSFEDIRQGIAYTAKLANYPLDLERVVIAGHSAGGHLALLAGAEIENVDGVIGLAAITDIVAYSRGQNSCQKAAIAFMGGDYETSPAAYHAANPVDKTLHSNTRLLHGDSDAIVPPDQARVAGAATGMVAGGGHFDWVHPGTPAFQLLLATLEDIFKREP